MKPISVATFLFVLCLAEIILAFRPAFIPTGTQRTSSSSSSSSSLRTPSSSFYYPQPRQTVSESSSRPRSITILFGEVQKKSYSATRGGEDEDSSSASTDDDLHVHTNHRQRQRIFRRCGFVMNRIMNPLQFANFHDNDNSNNKHHQVLLAGSSGGIGSVGNVIKNTWKRIKKLHDPKVYMILMIVAGIRWNWIMRSIFYWFSFGFLIKWYRARYVFKIPVWDRQPNWNNVITSKEQEKDLHALTCKNCGSTLFIAKSREFFFEGSTGLGGLGCFTCGAKGKDNFYEDRERIVEDVADMDDYFEYERPLDLISAYERRKLLKETKGDEEKANQILSQRLESSSATSATTAADAPPETTTDSSSSEEESMTDNVVAAQEEEEKEEPQHQQPEAVVEELKKSSPPPQPKPPVQPPSAPKSAPVGGPSLIRSKPAVTNDDDDLDLLGMDDF